MSTRRRDRKSDSGRTGGDPEADQPTPPGESLLWGPVRELALKIAGTARYGLPPALSPEMEPTEWLDRRERNGSGGIRYGVFRVKEAVKIQDW
ncbi:Uncharacterized protein TPS_00644 [Trichinella pseudospiralis]